MSEQLPTNSEVTGANRDLRWPRLVANSLWTVICFAIAWFAMDLITSVWNHKFKTDVFSLRVLWWFAKAVVVGLFSGLCTGFFTWLAQEIFGRPETNSSERTGG
jgi:TRAP-type C4-dicarboxylate transport system permease small subunit